MIFQDPVLCAKSLFFLLVCLALKFTDIVDYTEMAHTEALW